MTKDEAMQQVLEALEQIDGIDTETECVTIDVGDAIAVLREALAEPPAQQEPVATDWERIARVQNAKLMAICDEPKGFEKLCEVMDRYERTSPPAQRPWVGLTDEEFESIEKATLNVHGIPKYFGTAIEAKLKEKNT